MVRSSVIFVSVHSNGSLPLHYIRLSLITVVPMILEPVINTTLTINEDSPVVFTCSAVCLPAPEISWYRNGSILERATNSRVMLGAPSSPENYTFTVDGEDLGIVYRVTRNLTLDDTEDTDSGFYSCMARNGNAMKPNVSREFELIVQRKPISATSTWVICMSPFLQLPL